MKKILFALISLSIASYSVNAQNIHKCSTTKKSHQLEGESSEYRSARLNRKNLEAFNESNRVQRTAQVVTIPVVVHLVYNTNFPEQSISDAQVLSQIQVLNEDFRRTNANKTQTPAAFASLAADVEIEFVLANRDPNGNVTNGITRTLTTVTDWANEDDYDDIKLAVKGGKTPWPNTKYLNIWVGNLGDLNLGGTLGYAYFPGAPANIDGVVIHYEVFGLSDYAPYNLGRTATHEVGHYLGLDHIWGDENFEDPANPDECADTDYVSDTPNQLDATYGCPSFPETDVCTPNAPGTMFMNYMDYSNDACMNMFTLGQKTLMRTNLATYRSGLLTSSGYVSGLFDTHYTTPQGISIYPNPAKEKVNVSSTQFNKGVITLINGLGVIVHTEQFSSSEHVINTSNLEKGLYIIEISSEDKSVKSKLMINE